jgi:hypothetical protein
MENEEQLTDIEVMDLQDEGYTDEQLKAMSPAHKKAIAKSLMGKNNPAYKDGRRSYRRIAGAKDNDGSLIHHKDGDSKNNSPSNLEKIPESKRSEHEKKHSRQNNFNKSGGRQPVARGYKSKT